MPFPNDLVLVTVNGTILHPDGTPAAGTVTFRMPYPLRDTGSGHVVVGVTPPVVATLDVSGAFSVRLPATDQAAVSPINWAYTILIATDASTFSFTAQLPSSPSTTTLDALIPLVTPPTPGVYVPLTYIGQPNGVPSLDATGRMPASQLPSGGGVPDATPTTKGVIELAGDLAGTATAVQVTGTHLAAPLPITQGGTGSATQNFVDLSTAQTVGGVKTFSSAPVVPSGAFPESAVANLVSDLAAKAPTSRLITASTGLTGGGDLTADRTLAVSYGTTAGTAAQGNDSRITGAVQASTATTKGDLLVATAASAIARLGVGSDTQVLTADSSQAAGMKWSAPSGGGPVFPLSGYGLLTASDDPGLFENPQSLASGTVFGARCWVPANTPLSNLTAAVRTGGTYSSSAVPNRLGLYDDTGALIQATTDDSTLWTTAGWASRSITTVAAQSTGRWVYILYIIGGFTGVAVPYLDGASDSNAPWLCQNVSNAGNRRSFYLNGQSALPASFTPTSVGTDTGFIPLVGAY